MKNPFLFFSFFVAFATTFICQGQNTTQADQNLCDWISRAKNNNLDSAKLAIDSFVLAGANINCNCELTKTYTNGLRVLANGIKNAFTSFFLQRKHQDHRGETYTQKEYYTPVHLWTLADKKALVEYVVKKYGANLNLQTLQKTYLLEEVVASNQLETAQWLHSLGASAENIKICTNSLPTFDWLLSVGGKIEKTDWVCMSNNEAVLQATLEKYKPNLAAASYANTSHWKSLSPKTLALVFQCGVKPDTELIDFYFNFSARNMENYAPIFDQYGADLSACGFFTCPMQAAIENNKLSVVKLLADKGIFTVKRPICTDNIAILDYLVAKGFPNENIDVSCLLEKPDILEIVLKKYQPNLALLQQKSNFSEISLRSLDLLAAAGFKPSNAMLVALLDSEAKLKLVVQKYKPDLTFLSGNSDLSSASAASLDFLFGLGVTPAEDLLSYQLNFSVDKVANYKLVQVYSKHKKNVNSCGFFGCPLEIAIKRDDFDTFKLLVNNGADLTQKFSNGENAKEYAESAGKKQFVAYLASR